MKDQINSEHRQVGLVERSVDCAKRLVELYHDNDGEIDMTSSTSVCVCALIMMMISMFSAGSECCDWCL